MSLDGSIYMVRLLEIDLKQVTFNRDGQVIWPRMGGDNSATIVDGALLLHDSTQPDKLAETAELTGMFEARDVRLPSIVLPHISAQSTIGTILVGRQADLYCFRRIGCISVAIPAGRLQM